MEDKRRGKIGEKRDKNEQTVGFIAEKLPHNEQSEATDKLSIKIATKKQSALPMARLTIYIFLREIIDL